MFKLQNTNIFGILLSHLRGIMMGLIEDAIVPREISRQEILWIEDKVIDFLHEAKQGKFIRNVKTQLWKKLHQNTDE